MIQPFDKLPITFLKQTSVKESVSIVHDSYDIIYILSGKLTIIKNEAKTVYCSNDISLINPNQLYKLEYDSENLIVHMGIQPYFIEHYLGSYGIIICDSVLEPNNNYTALKQLVTSIAANYLEDAAYHALVLYGLLFQLLDQLKNENYFSPTFDTKIPEKYKQRIYTMVQFVDEHYNEAITLDSLARDLFLTPQYLSKFFKKYFHKSFKEYLLEKRLFHAYRDLCYTNDSITEIAIHHGFSDITAFSKAFRSFYHITPSKYRKKKHTISKQEDVSSYFTTDSVYSQSNTTDIRHAKPFVNHYSALINIGLSKNLLLENFRKQILKARTDLHFQYLRIQGFISSSFIPKVLPNYEYYFLDADHVLDFLYENHLIPFFELSRLPYMKSLSYEAFHDLSYIPVNRRFLDLLEAFLKHCSIMYPDTWMAKWKFEFWKNPKESSAQYVSHFLQIKALLNQHLPNASLGGPGFHSCEHKKELEEILEQFSVQKAYPDFISAYFDLLTNVEQGQYILSTDKNIMLKRVRELHASINVYFSNIPFYITEWNSVFLPNVPIQYSCFQAAFICKTVIELNDFCDFMGYWIFSDVTAYQDPIHARAFDFWGQGLYNKDGISMPAYYAFQLLNQLGNTIIKQGKNFCITQREKDHYQIITYNYAHFSSSVSLNTDTKIPFSNIYDLFEKIPPLEMKFTLNFLTPGVYRISRFLLDRANGSVLDLWIGGFANSNIDEMEYLIDIKLPSSTQLDYFQKSCIPEIRTIFLTAEDTLTVDSLILPHNVCMWDIIRQI